MPRSRPCRVDDAVDGANIGAAVSLATTVSAVCVYIETPAAFCAPIFQ